MFPIRISRTLARAAARLLVACAVARPAPAGAADGAGAAEAIAAPAPAAATGAAASSAPDSSVSASTPHDALDAVRVARVRRLASTWTDARMDVLTRSGSLRTGVFRGLRGEALLLAPDAGDPETVPVRELSRITLHRRPADLAVAAVVAVGVAGLCGAVGALGLDTDAGGTAAMAAGGLVIGGGIGWRTICRERVVSFE